MANEVKTVPKILLEIDGTPCSQDLRADILQISVEESMHLPAMFTLVIANNYLSGNDAPPWRHQQLFAIGKTIKIGFGSSSIDTTNNSNTYNEGYILEGEITAMESHFTPGNAAPIIIRGYDISHRLHRGLYNRSFQDMTDSDIVKKIALEVGFTTSTLQVDTTTPTHAYVFQENQTNMEFLRERAARNGFELFVQDGKLNFRKPKQDDSLKLKLAWRKNLQSFRVRLTSAEQVKEVEVRGWDYTKKEAIVSTKNTDALITTTEYGSGKNTSTVFNGKPTAPKVVVIDQPVFSVGEADTMAQALVNELGGVFVYADGKADGNPKIRPGRVIELADMDKYSGKYYVTETRHLYYDNIYTTEFSVRGLRGGNLLDMLSPATRLQAGQTLLVGIVTNNNDPQGLGRVRVKFPTLTEEHDSNWARVVGAGVGKERGFDCLPEINDEVLVGFEHGDIHRPYILGGMWNGVDKPPADIKENVAGEQGGPVRLRTIKTRTGHTFQFVEEDKGNSKKGVYLDTVYTHHLHLNDSDQKIEIKTKEAHYALLDDKNQKVEVKTKGSHQLLMDDSGKKIDLVSSGDLNIKSGGSGSANNININGGTITLKAQNTITLEVGSNKIEISTSGITINGSTVSIN